MPASNAKLKANHKYDAKAYDKYLLRIRKDGDLTKEVIDKAAADQGESLNQFILTAIRERIERG